MVFGLKVQRILPKLIRGAVGKPELPKMPEEGWNVPLMFETLTFENDGWLEARIMESCQYIRGSVHLCLPEKWKQVLPTHVPGQ